MKLLKKSFLSVAVLLTLSSIIAKILGFLKDVLVSYYYGTTEYTDAFFLMLSIPYILVTVLTSASDSAIIPQYNRLISKYNRKYADKFFSNILNLSTLLSIVICSSTFIFAPLVITFVAPEFNDVQNDVGILYLRIFSFIGLFNLLYCYFSSYNTRYRDALTRSLIPVISNIILIFTIMIFHDEKLLGYAYAFLLVSILGGILPIYSSFRIGYKHDFRMNVKDDESKTFYKAALPIAGTALVFDLYMFCARLFATGLETGSISALNYASRITAMFDSLIVVGLGAVLLTYLSEIYINNNLALLRKSIEKIIFILLMILLPVVVFSMIMSNEIITFIYMRGKFDAASVKMVSNVFMYISPQILLLSIQAILSKIFYSMGNIKTPLIGTSVGFICNIVLCIILSRLFGINGIAFGMSLSMTVSVLILIIHLNRTIGFLHFHFLKKICIFIIALLIMMIEINLLKQFINSSFFAILLCGLVGIGTYILLVIKLLPSEMNELKEVLKKAK